MSPRWSVQLAVDPSESGPLSGVMSIARVAEMRGMSVAGPSPADPDGVDTVTFELETPEAKDARLLAQHLIEKMRVAAGLARLRGPTPVVWVAPMSEGWASSQRFLSTARELLDSEHYEMAVLAAQVHLELQVGILVRQAVAASGSTAIAKQTEGQRGWAPHDRLG